MAFQLTRSALAERFHALGTLARVAVGIAICLVVAAILFWLLNQIFYYYLARSYTEELANAYDLNRHLANALVWASFAAIVFFASYLFSISKQRRIIGACGFLLLLIGHSLAVWHGVREDNFSRSGEAVRCYVLTRDNFKILNRLGVDPETGRECRPMTAQIVERLQEYRKGKRPTQIKDKEPSFFDPLTGEPVIWFAKEDGDRIELFDLMGFHPRTGEELLPVDRKTADAWRKQMATTITRIPVRVDPNQFTPFDAVTGAAKMWFWRGTEGEFEFYDGPGFQPRTGEPLKIISREILVDWKNSVEAAARKKKAEDEQRTREREEQAAREAAARLAEQRARQEAILQEQKERADLAERERLARAAEAEARERQQRSAMDCDRLAANPTDQRKTADGVTFEMLKVQADQAFEACSNAVKLFPTEPRYRYQLGRAVYFKDKKQAFEIFQALVSARYPAAYDNLGGMYLYDRKDMKTAIQLFNTGASLGDADSMVSLADLIEKGHVPNPDPFRTKWAFLKRAADLGHVGAQRAINKQLEQEDANRRAGEIATQLLGGILGGMRR